MSRPTDHRRTGSALRIVVISTALGAFGSMSAVANDTPATRVQLIPIELSKETDGPSRINFTAKLRMLSQRVAATSCIFAAGGDGEASSAALKGAAAEFRKIMVALAVGDESLGIIGPEEAAKVLKGLAVLERDWAPVEAAVADLLAGGDSAAALATIYAGEGKVLGVAQKLTAEVTGLYANPNQMSQANAMAIDFEGRQRMLLQKMTKEACQISTGGATAETQAMLEKTVATFEMTLTALIDGMPEAGVQPAPTPEIRAALELLRTDWQGKRAVLEGVLAGTPLDAAGLGALLTTADSMMKSVNDVVAEYAKTATF